MLEQHIEIIDTILNGFHPITHDVLPREHAFSDPDVIRALYSAIKAMRYVNEHYEEVEKIIKRDQFKETIPEKSKGLKNRLGNAGASWTQEDEAKLIDMFNERRPIAEIAANLGRTSGAIRSRMKKLGLIDYKNQYVDGLRPFRKKDEELLRTMYENGLGIEIMASRFEVSEEAIKTRLFYMGLTKDAPKILPDRSRKNGEKNGRRLGGDAGIGPNNRSESADKIMCIMDTKEL